MKSAVNESPRRSARLFVSQPEYDDAKDVRIQFGIRGTLLYQLWKQNLVTSVVLKGRGKRLFDYRSIRKYLASQEGQ